MGMEPQGNRPGVRPGDRITEEVYGRVFRYLCKLCAGHTELAEELTQETMVRLLRSHGQLREPDQFIPWAFRIATNLWRDERRRLRAVRRLPVPPQSSDEPSAEQQELTRKVIRQLERLPEVYRVALTLRYLEGLDYDTMSEILDTPLVTLRSHIARGRQLIRRQLED